MKKLALVEWSVSSEPSDNKGNFIRLAGRESGLISWLLSLAKIEPIHHLRINADRVEFRSSSLSGVQSRIIPLERVSSTYYEFYRPWKEAVALFVLLAIFLNIPAAIGGMFMGEIGAAIGFCVGFFLAIGAGILYYWLKKAIIVGIVEFSGLVSALAFERSLIEGIELSAQMGKEFATNVDWHLANTLNKRLSPTLGRH